MNLPNSLTISRIFIIPLLVAILLTGRIEQRELWGGLLFVAASITDWLDGYLARKRNQVTTLGILLDPIADKLLVSSAFISLVQMGIAPAWMVVVIIGREFAVSGLRSIASAEGFTIDASTMGKLKMFFQVLAITLLIFGSTAGKDSVVRWMGEILLWAVVVFSIISMIQYFWRFWSQIDERVKYRQRQKMIHLMAKRREKSNV
ncbi:MAG TPA: CDP-diacylglycerol--glycerol-3-phosphate 3-phosphatidyltransferase [Acidobacteriota bacterium]|jgi:CDP-diacylglycerol--glycerol-3-phosphate 3-phosphatidyltransferase|nr:CDP-diacylglycerol--glycerol-3-phosphate 3-phosphatidyltransferase [Acidobacteriota bacterium]